MTSVLHITPVADEANCWLPPRRMARYQIAKAVGGLLIGGIFAGWLVIQWSSVPMRIFAMVLMFVTAWIVAASIAEDRRRCKGRQLELDGDVLTVTKPDGRSHISVADIARGQWNEETYDAAGLWLYNSAGHVLAHLDLDFIGDQDEARAFLHWARQRTELSFNIDWPTTA